MNKSSEDELFISFQEKVQDTSKSEDAFLSSPELRDSLDKKNNSQSDLLETCSNCKKEYSMTSFEANLLDNLCGFCNRSLTEFLKSGMHNFLWLLFLILSSTLISNR